LYRDISEKDYRPRANIVKDEKSDLVTNSHSILTRCRNHYSQLLNVLGINDVRQTEIHTAEPLVSEPSAFEDEMAIEKLKSHKSPCIDQILAELFKVRGRTIHYEIYKPIHSKSDVWLTVHRNSVWIRKTN